LEKLAKSESGTTLDVLVDCPSAIDEIPGILSKEGYKVQTTQIKDGEWAIRAEK
jgi:TusA-related sulfurtransferase